LANPELGAKQICPNCQSKFYDLGKRPALCPKCHTSFDPEEAVRARRTRARSTVPDYEEPEEKEVKVKEEDADGFGEEADETPEIDQAPDAEPLETDDADEPGVVAPADDLGVDFAEDEELAEDDEDVPFLEDEEEDFPDDEIEGLPEEGDADDR